MTDPKDIVRHGYDKVSRAYRGDRFDLGDDPTYRQIMDLLLPRLAAGSRILDLGCGCGIPAARDLARLHQVTGVDISPIQIEMYWSHADEKTYRTWLEDLGLRILERRFLPEGEGGHSLFLSRKLPEGGWDETSG